MFFEISAVFMPVPAEVMCVGGDFIFPDLKGPLRAMASATGGAGHFKSCTAEKEPRGAGG